MHRPLIRLAGRVALAGALTLTLLAPGAVLAADPATPSPTASEGAISVDPTFITSTESPKGAVLSATGRPQHTLPPTDAAAGSSPTGASAEGLPLLLLALATICLVAARLPEVRRR